MIVARLQGGLGNQLFQYAAARQAAERWKTPLAFDVSWFGQNKDDTPRTFDLNRAGLNPEVWSGVPKIDVTFQEDTKSFRPISADRQKTVLLQGFFQSERHFADIGDRLTRELLSYVGGGQDFRTLREQITKEDTAVSIHIRRSDYLKNEATYRFHGICGRPYYAEALKRIKGLVKNPVFYVFCEDKADAAELLTNEKYQIIERTPGRTDFEDLLLMAACRHHIIANSSFSWWGAYLGRLSGGHTCYPDRWFATDLNGANDLPLGSWISIPNYSYYFSVVIPTFNRSQDLAKAIRSVLGQTFTDWEILICDDGSSDGSRDLVLSEFPGPRIRWLDCGRNGRPAIPRNQGGAFAQGKYLAFLDDDDAWKPGKLEHQFHQLESLGCIGVSSNAVTNKPGRLSVPYHEEAIPEILDQDTLLNTNYVICSSAVVRREAFLEVGGFPPQRMFKAVEDYGLWLKLTTIGPIHYSKDLLVEYSYSSPDSIRNAQTAQNLKKLLAAFRLWRILPRWARFGL